MYDEYGLYFDKKKRLILKDVNMCIYFKFYLFIEILSIFFYFFWNN